MQKTPLCHKHNKKTKLSILLLTTLLSATSIVSVNSVHAEEQDFSTLPFYEETREVFENTKTSVIKFFDFELTWPIEYVVQEWDTINSISKRFKIEPKWLMKSNVGVIDEDILNYDYKNFAKVGQKILIPNKTGIAYKVLKGDDIKKIIKEFQISEEQFLNFNDTFDVKEWDIVLFPVPNFMLEDNEHLKRKGTFYWGNCTWYVDSKVKGIDWNWNAKHWISNAKAKGHTVGNIPMKWAIVQFGWRWMPLWHVAYVEEVYENSFKISEMNYKKLWVRTERIIDNSNATIKWFIYLWEVKENFLSQKLDKIIAKSVIKNNE